VIGKAPLLPDRARLPPPARFLRLAFFATYWTVIAGLCASLTIAVIGSQVRFWSQPADAVPQRNLETCRESVRAMAAELDDAGQRAMDLAERRPQGALPSFRRFGADWDSRWRQVRFECRSAAEEEGSDALMNVHVAVLDHRYALESLVRRHATGEGRARARIAARLPDGSAP